MFRSLHIDNMEDKPNIDNTNAVIDHINNEHKKKMRTCPHCKQPYEIKSTWDALFRMPTLQEWLVLFMMVMMFVGAWAYNHDVSICRDFIKNADVYCIQRSQVHNDSYNPYNPPILNTSGVWIINNSNSSAIQNSSMFGNNSIYVNENITNVTSLNESNQTNINLNLSNSNETKS